MEANPVLSRDVPGRIQGTRGYRVARVVAYAAYETALSNLTGLL